MTKLENLSLLFSTAALTFHNMKSRNILYVCWFLLLTFSLRENFVSTDTSTKKEECSQDFLNLIQQSREECSGDITEIASDDDEEEEPEVTEVEEVTEVTEESTTKRSRTTRRPRTTKRPRRTTKRPRRRTTKRPKRSTKRPRKNTERSRRGNNSRSRSRRQVIGQCLTDKIKSHKIGMEIISKCEELKLSPALLDVRILSSPDEELDTCISNAVHKCETT